VRVDSEGVRNKHPIIQQEAVNDLLCHLETYKSMVPDERHPRALRELAEETAKTFSIIYQQSWLTEESPRGLKDHLCNTYLQEGPEGGSWELQACQPDLGARQDYGVIYPECTL